MRMALVIEHEGHRITVEQGQQPGDQPGDQSGRANAAAFDFSRIARVAMCVVACVGQTSGRAAGDQEQPDHQEQPGDDQGDEQPARDASPATPQPATTHGNRRTPSTRG